MTEPKTPVKKPRKATDLAKPSELNTAADRRNWLRKRAGWPVKGT